MAKIAGAQAFSLVSEIAVTVAGGLAAYDLDSALHPCPSLSEGEHSARYAIM